MADSEGARKTGKFIAVCTTPDVCKTPVGIAVVPIPYPITSNMNDSMSVSSNVNFGGDPAYVHDKSKISKVTGDEPGTTGGIKSGTNRSMVETISGSSSVNVNKKPVVRHTDPCRMNNGNTMGKVIYQGTSKSASGISADSNPPVKPATPPEEAAKTAKKGLWSKMSEGVHTTLDVAGFIPGLGAIPDLANAAIYGLEGNAAMAGISAIAAVPGVGDGIKAGTMVVKGGKQILKQAEKKTAKEAAEQAVKKTEKEIAEKLAEKKAKKEVAEQAAKKKGKDGLTVAGKKKYSRGKFRKGVRKKVWEDAKRESKDGAVRDPVTNKEIAESDKWDMGHKPGYEHSKHVESAADRSLSRKEFLDEFNNPSHYRPELPSSNRSHAGELKTNDYFGP